MKLKICQSKFNKGWKIKRNEITVAIFKIYEKNYRKK